MVCNHPLETGMCSIVMRTHSLSCAGIQRWKWVSFRCWAAINFVGEMSNEEEDTPPPPYPPLGFLLAVKNSASLLALCFLALGGKSLTSDCTWKNIEIPEMLKLVHIMNKNIILQCRHTETPGVRLVRNRVNV